MKKQWGYALFCVKTVVRESGNFELARLKKKNYIAICQLSGVVLLVCFLASTLCAHSNQRRQVTMAWHDKITWSIIFPSILAIK